MVFQSFNLFADKTILENVTLGPIDVRKIPRETAEKRGMELLERVGIATHASKYPAQLSGGQQQRTAIARALAMDPKMILFDEPTSPLDPEMVQEGPDVMIGLARNGMSMLVVTHEMGFARRAADRVVLMTAGQIVEENTPDEFFARPRTDRANEFLSKILEPSGARSNTRSNNPSWSPECGCLRSSSRSQWASWPAVVPPAAGPSSTGSRRNNKVVVGTRGTSPAWA